LTKENEQLREIAAEQRRTINSLKMVVDDNVTRTKEAIRMCNYNEQYSRKFNIKIMNYQKKEGEDLRSDFINKIAKEKHVIIYVKFIPGASKCLCMYCTVEIPDAFKML
jgi:hypothetical protein